MGTSHQAQANVEGHPAVVISAATSLQQKTVARADSIESDDNPLRRLSLLADKARSESFLYGPASTVVDGEAAGLRQDKIAKARARIRSGYYDQPEIKQLIADKLADKLTGTPPENPETTT